VSQPEPRVYLQAARFVIRVTRQDEPRPLYRAFLYERMIATGAEFCMVEGFHRKRENAVVGVLSAALGTLLADRDPTACETCGARVGELGGRDAKTGKLVCFDHVTRGAP
jgi:hypothetical protein